MIVSFSVENFRSFGSEETLSMVASKRLSSHQSHLAKIADSGESCLRIGVVYGANGAGKSNLTKAVAYLQQLALRSRDRTSGTGRRAFGFGSLSSKVSSFDLQFEFDGKLYRYGIVLNDRVILEEWLVKIVGNREAVCFERTTSREGTKVSGPITSVAASEKMRALSTVGGPENQTFLATVRATLDKEDVAEPVADAIAWFGERLQILQPTSPLYNLGALLEGDAKLLNFTSDFLRAVSTGVDHLSIVKDETSEQQLRALLPDLVVDSILEKEKKGDGRVFLIGDGKKNLTVEQSKDGALFLISIKAVHNHSGRTGTLEIEEESDGTRRLLDLLPALHLLAQSNLVLIADEIDRSMHPLLTWEYLKFFLKAAEATHSQMIVTTHESNLLDQDLLRRDEIWFAEKDLTGETRLYSLSDYKARNDLKLKKHYLQGRFGAIPFLGDVERLLKGSNGDVD